MKVRKAVIPAAGFGTRMLPITKAQPKERLPVVNKPVIQYVVEEAVASGITDILLIIGKGKRAIEEYFDRNIQLEEQLEEKNKETLLKQVKQISELADIYFVWQKELNGLGDAIRYAEKHVGNEPFAVLLGDTIMEPGYAPVTQQLCEIFEKRHASVAALEEVDPEMVHRYGVIDGTEVSESLLQATNWIEKPGVEDAPSNLAVAGRYIFTPEIFDCLKNVAPGINNEVQLTDAMQLLLREQKMFGWIFSGRRFDVGNTLDFIKTNLEFGLKDEELRQDLISWLQSMEKTLNLQGTP